MTVPYVTVSLTTNYGKGGTGDSLLGEFEVGSRWFLTRNAAFFLAGYTTYDFEASDFHDGFEILFGYTYLWHK